MLRLAAALMALLRRRRFHSQVCSTRRGRADSGCMRKPAPAAPCTGQQAVLTLQNKHNYLCTRTSSSSDTFSECSITALTPKLPSQDTEDIIQLQYRSALCVVCVSVFCLFGHLVHLFLGFNSLVFWSHHQQLFSPSSCCKSCPTKATHPEQPLQVPSSARTRGLCTQKDGEALKHLFFWHCKKLCCKDPLIFREPIV